MKNNILMYHAYHCLSDSIGKKFKKRKMLEKLLIALIVILILGAAAVGIINNYVISVGESRIMTVEQAASLDDVDCIIVLGCKVRNDGSLSDMLRDRLIRGLELYNTGTSSKLLMSGDHGQKDYDEVGAMKHYAIQNGVPSENIFMDHAGFSTYETVYRAKEIFDADKVVIVTQEYHLYRALQIAKQLGLEAYGVPSDLNIYSGQMARDFREILARCKDFALCIVKPEPTYLGDVIPVSGNGDITND